MNAIRTKLNRVLRLMWIWLSPWGWKEVVQTQGRLILIKEHPGWEWGGGRWGSLLPRNREEEGKADLTGKEKERNGEKRKWEGCYVFCCFSTPIPQAKWCLSPGPHIALAVTDLPFSSPYLQSVVQRGADEWINLSRIYLNNGVDSFTPFTGTLMEGDWKWSC